VDLAPAPDRVACAGNAGDVMAATTGRAG
jgi:hypothetical protein